MNRASWLICLSCALSCANDPQPKGPGPKPDLKTKVIDRVGRAAVSTALVAVLDDGVLKGMKHDAYNSSEPTEWVQFGGEIQKNLAIYDALDTICGNQLLAGSAGVARYMGLATALNDDRIYINTNAGTCTQYLAVELDATNIITNDDCGGRTLSYDVIDVTYSALAIGAPTGVSDGVDRDGEDHSNDTFPFVAPP